MKKAVKKIAGAVLILLALGIAITPIVLEDGIEALIVIAIAILIILLIAAGEWLLIE